MVQNIAYLSQNLKHKQTKAHNDDKKFTFKSQNDNKNKITGHLQRTLKVDPLRP